MARVWRDDYYLKWHGKEVFTKATAANRHAMYKACKLVKEEAKRSLLNVHSEPGSPPKIITGKLWKAIRYGVHIQRGGVTGFIGPRRKRAPHGLWLELGTVKMRPYPFMRTALIRNWRKINRIFKEANG